MTYMAEQLLCHVRIITTTKTCSVHYKVSERTKSPIKRIGILCSSVQCSTARTLHVNFYGFMPDYFLLKIDQITNSEYRCLQNSALRKCFLKTQVCHCTCFLCFINNEALDPGPNWCFSCWDKPQCLL